MKSFLYYYYKLFPKKYIQNRYKTKQSYWEFNNSKTNNIPDNNYTLW